MHSPFIAGILFLLSLGAGITGMAYGFSSGRYRTDNDVIEGLTQPMKLLGVYFVIAFFAAQMFACFEYSHLDKCLAIMGADLLSSFEPAPLSALILFILFTALINLIMVSATSKWAFMSFIFIQQNHSDQRQNYHNTGKAVLQNMKRKICPYHR